MAIWEWVHSTSSSIDAIMAQSAKRADGTTPSDRTYVPSGSIQQTVTLTALNMTYSESQSEYAKLGTSQTYTTLDGQTYTGIVVGHSDQVKNTGYYQVTVTLKIPYVAA